MSRLYFFSLRASQWFTILGLTILLGAGIGGWIFYQKVSLEDSKKIKRRVAEKHVENIQPHKQAIKADLRPNPQIAHSADMGKTSVNPNAREQFDQTPKTAKEVIDHILLSIKNLEDQDFGHFPYSPSFKLYLQQLCDFGEEGSQAIQEFLRTKQDIIFGTRQDYVYNIHNPSLRICLIDNLSRMNNPISQAINLEILGEASSGLEIVFATRNLEKFSPGIYEKKALEAASKIISTQLNSALPEDANAPLPSDARVFEVVGYYQAKEMIPQVEEWLKKQPALVDWWIPNLISFSAEDQFSGLQSLIANESLRERLSGKLGVLSHFDLKSDGIRHLTREFFTKEKDENAKAFLIQLVGDDTEETHSLYISHHPDVMVNYRLKRTFAEIENSGWPTPESRLKLLEELEPELNTPLLKERLEEARE